MSFHLIEVYRIEAAGGAVKRKYDRLMAQAEGAQPGAPAFMAKVDFERQWQADPELAKAVAQSEEGLDETPQEEPKLLPAPEPTMLHLWIPNKGEEQ